MSTAFSWNENHVHHSASYHPERPERIQAVIERLQSSPLWSKLDVLPPAPCGREQAALVHAPAYMDLLETATAYARHLDPDTYTTHRSLEAAYSSLGSLLAVTNAVLLGRATNGFAAARPPGHHATPDRAMGFCLLSNAAIAARWAQHEHGISRVAIVDFDVHHGNGTQDAFYADDSVLYMSTHQWPLYPGTGNRKERGTGAGEGTTVNVPLPSGAGDDALHDAFVREFKPALNAFGPELLIVSAGYDAHVRDPLAGLTATTRGFSRLMTMLLEWADACCRGRLVAVLEGGYDVEALSSSVTVSIERMLNPGSAAADHP